MSQPQTYIAVPITNIMRRIFSWLIVIDYALLAAFLLMLSSLSLRGGTFISLMLVIYNTLLTFLCFNREDAGNDSYIIYPTLSATLLAFICFLYFFFLI